MYACGIAWTQDAESYYQLPLFQGMEVWGIVGSFLFGAFTALNCETKGTDAFSMLLVVVNTTNHEGIQRQTEVVHSNL